MSKFNEIPGVITESDVALATLKAQTIGNKYGKVIVEPIGSNDAARLNAIIASVGAKFPIYLNSGTFDIETPILPISGLKLQGVKGKTILNSSQTPGGDTAFCINHECVHSGTGTLSDGIGGGDVTVGENTFKTTTSFADGQWLWIGQGVATYIGSQYQVTGTPTGPDGNGAYTVTVDRPILFAFKAGESVDVITLQLTDCDITDVILSGTVDRYYRVLGGRKCHFDGEIIGSGSGHGMSWDLGCLDCSSLVVARNSGRGTTLEACERGSFQCSAYHCSYGVLVYDSINCSLNDCSHSNDGSAGTSGIVLLTNPGNPAGFGCKNINVYGGLQSNCETGVNVSTSTNCIFIGTQAEDCDINFSFASSSSKCTFDGTSSYRASGTNAIGYLIQGAGCRMLTPHSYGDGKCVQVSGSSVDILDIFAPDFTAYTVRGIKPDTDLAVGSKINIYGGNISGTIVDLVCIDQFGPCDILVDSTKIGLGTTGGGGAFGFFMRAGATGGTLTLRDIKMTQGGAGAAGYNGVSGHKLILEGYNSFIVTTPITLNGSMSNHMTTYPTAGTWYVGDIVWNSTPTFGQQLGWICTVAGSPGTWTALSDLTVASPWATIPTSAYTATPPTTSTITFSSDYTQKIFPGMPVRVLSKTGVSYNDGYTQISGFNGITGINSGILDPSGRLYLTVVSEGGGNFHIDGYNNSSRSSGTQVFHTASYSGAGSVAITADNSSGLGGTLTIPAATLAADTDIYVEFYLWYVVDSITSTTLTLAGPPLTTGSASISAIWYDPIRQVENITIGLPGYYALVAHSTALKTFLGMYAKWHKSRGRVARFMVEASTVSGTPPKANLKVGTNAVCPDNSGDGLTISVADTEYTTIVNLTPQYLLVEPKGYFEVSNTQGATSPTYDADLTMVVTVVLE